MKKWALFIALLTIAVLAFSACSAPTPQVIEKPVTVVVEKEVSVEKQVLQTVLVEKEKVVSQEKVVTSVVEKEKIVEKVTVVTATPLPAGPKVLIIGQGQEPDTLYMYGGSMLASSHVQHALRESMMTGLSFGYQAVLVEKVPNVDDGDAVINKVTVKAGEKYVEEGEVKAAEKDMELEQLVVTWKLKPGLKYEDGVALTAADSVFSREVACHPDSGTSKYLCDRTASYEAPDDVTIVWTGLPGYMDATYFANIYNVLPKHVLGNVAVKDIATSAWARKPLSSGPFKLVEWVAGDHITVERNPNYYRASEGLPKVDRVIFKFIPDTNQLVAQLLAGEIDIGTQDGLDVNYSPFLLQAEASGILKPQYITGTTWEHIDFNIQPFDDRYVFFDDVRVRQAIAHGTDRQSMVDNIMYGRSQVQNAYIPDIHPMYPPADRITVYDYDPEKAKALLAEAGWADSNNDGYLDKGGQIFEISIGTTAGNAMRQASTQLFQQNMKDIGIKVNLDFIPSTLWFADGPEGPLFGRRYDLGLFAWLTGVEPPGDIYLCSEIPGPDNAWGPQNQTGYCNPEYDAWVNKAMGTLSKAEQTAAWTEAISIWSKEIPVLPLFARIKLCATRPEITGVIMDPTENSEMWNIENFDIVQ